MKKVSLIMVASFLAASAMYTSCKKDDTSTSSSITDADVAQVQDNSIASSAYDDVDTEVSAAVGTGLKSDLVGDSTIKPVVTIISKEKGKIVKNLTYNGINRRGKVRTGSILVTITYPTVGDSTDETKWVKTITFDNYTVGERKIEGTKTITYQGKVDGTHPQWEVKLVDGKVTLKNGKTVTAEYTRTRVMIEGFLTPLNFEDDVFQINGTGSGLNRKGIEYTSTLTDIVKAAGCPYFKSGIETFVSEKKTKVITYNGGDSCNPSATIEVNGKTKIVNIDTEAN
jgi:hypothetical protein